MEPHYLIFQLYKSNNACVGDLAEPIKLFYSRICCKPDDSRQFSPSKEAFNAQSTKVLYSNATKPRCKALVVLHLNNSPKISLSFIESLVE